MNKSQQKFIELLSYISFWWRGSCGRKNIFISILFFLNKIKYNKKKICFQLKNFQ